MADPIHQFQITKLFTITKIGSAATMILSPSGTDCGRRRRAISAGIRLSSPLAGFTSGGARTAHPLSGRELRALRRLQRESEASPFVFVSERGTLFVNAPSQRSRPNPMVA